MTTDAGLTFALQRLSDAPNREALRRVWESLSVAYQRNARLIELKDKLKANLK